MESLSFVVADFINSINSSAFVPPVFSFQCLYYCSPSDDVHVGDDDDADATDCRRGWGPGS